MGYIVLKNFKKKTNFDCLSVGLIGGIGVGKSTVREIFITKGIDCIDADSISRKLYVKNSNVYEKIVEHFGEKILDETGEIDRKKLGEIVFKDSQEMKILEQITHSEINDEARKFLSTIPKGKIGVYESTKLIETKFYEELDVIICVASSMDTRFDRLKMNRQMSEYDIELRIKKQTTDLENLQVSHILLENESDLDELEKNVEDIIRFLQK